MNEPTGFEPRNRHECWFCRPSKYKDLPDGKTLCARCGALCDGKKSRMDICPECDKYLDEKFKGGTE